MTRHRSHNRPRRPEPPAPALQVPAPASSTPLVPATARAALSPRLRRSAHNQTRPSPLVGEGQVSAALRQTSAAFQNVARTAAPANNAIAIAFKALSPVGHHLITSSPHHPIIPKCGRPYRTHSQAAAAAHRIREHQRASGRPPSARPLPCPRCAGYHIQTG